MKVMLADDEPHHALLLELFLRKWGYEDVSSWMDGGQVLRALEAEREPCLVILDWLMPVLNGIEVTRTIKGSRSDVYVVMVTGKAQARDRSHAMSAGADDFIAKPYEPEALRTALRRGCEALDRARKV